MLGRSTIKVDGASRFHSRTVAALFVDTRPVDAVVFHHVGADNPAKFFSVPRSRGWPLVLGGVDGGEGWHSPLTACPGGSSTASGGPILCRCR
jgi:hypothetical protein